MAQTYKFGKDGTWATKKGSTLAYSDTNNAFKPLPFNFTRNSIATRVNKEGLIEVVGNDIPRIDYTDSTEGALLLENSSTNLITQSEDFSQWNKLSSTVTSNLITSPNGSQNADLINYNISSSNGYIRQLHSASKYVSFYVKYEDIQWLMIYGSGLGAGKFVDIKNNIVGGNVGSGANIQIINVGNDWKRIIFYSSSANITQTSIYAAISDGSYSSINLTGSVYLWGAQAEVGNLSSYIPTNGSIIQRAVETCNDSGNSEVFNDSQGVLFADIEFLTLEAGQDYFGINNGTNSQRVLMERNGSSFNTYISNVVLSTTNISKQNKISVSYKLNDFKMYLNGFKVDSATSGTTPTGLDRFEFKIGGLNIYTYAKTKEIGYYDTILTDLELETLTSYRTWESMVNELNLNIIYNG